MSGGNIHIEGPVAIMEESGSTVFFSKGNTTAGTNTVTNTAPQIKKLQTALEVAYWGEDNRFPQNIEQQMAYCGVGKAALEWKARALYGNGIIPGKIIESSGPASSSGAPADSTGNPGFAQRKPSVDEVFQPLDRSKYKEVYSFLETRSMFRFWLEYFQDWAWFGNNFPEIIFTKDGNKISHFIHQESCDSRFKQMNEQGIIDTVFLSKMWGAAKDQFARFDPKKSILNLLENPLQITEVDNKYVKKLGCIDMYDPLNTAKKISNELKGKEYISAILPVNYPSVNKTYYQVPAWDGARLSGWVEIASKIPALLKTIYNKAFKIRYHIEVPETYFEMKYGSERWQAMGMKEDGKEQIEARKNLLKEMNDYLSGSEKAYTSFISFFQINSHSNDEYGRVKITAIEDKSNIDKDLMTTSAANIEILTAMGIHPTLIGSGTVGTGTQRTGGSDQREAYLIYTSLLNLERQVALEPLYLARDFNEWDPDIVFRIRDTQLTTLDTGAGSTKVLS